MRRLFIKLTVFSYLILLTSSFSLFGENKSKVYISFIENFTLAETIYNKLEIKNKISIFTNRFIDRKAAKRTDVPPVIWEQIKLDIDYDSFKNDVISEIESFYTISEMQTLIDDYASREFIPITKISFRQELRHVIDDFSDNKVISKINEHLISNGYPQL